MPYGITQSEILRFLMKTGGYISCPAIAGKDAKVYDGNSSIPTAAYSISDAMLKTMIAEHLLEIAGTPTEGRRYTLTEKGVRLATRTPSDE